MHLVYKNKCRWEDWVLHDSPPQGSNPEDKACRTQPLFLPSGSIGSIVSGRFALFVCLLACLFRIVVIMVYAVAGTHTHITRRVVGTTAS